jgi:hypothetical protein
MLFQTLSDSPRDFYDEVTILCETDRITVPIYAYAPRADLHFDGYCLFGSVSPNQMTIRYVDLVNRGSKAAEFSFLQKEDIPFQVEPLSGRLGPEGSDDCFLRLKVSFSEGELGVYRSVLECEVNKTVIGTVLDMSAMVVRQQFETVSPEGTGRIEKLNFGTVYVGEEREQTFILVNDGPEEAEFHVVIPKPDNAESTDPHVYSAEPATGLMAPFEQVMSHHLGALAPGLRLVCVCVWLCLCIYNIYMCVCVCVLVYLFVCVPDASFSCGCSAFGHMPDACSSGVFPSQLTVKIKYHPPPKP